MNKNSYSILVNKILPVDVGDIIYDDVFYEVKDYINKNFIKELKSKIYRKRYLDDRDILFDLSKLYEHCSYTSNDLTIIISDTLKDKIKENKNYNLPHKKVYNSHSKLLNKLLLEDNIKTLEELNFFKVGENVDQFYEKCDELFKQYKNYDFEDENIKFNNILSKFIWEVGGCIGYYYLHGIESMSYDAKTREEIDYLQKLQDDYMWDYCIFINDLIVDDNKKLVYDVKVIKY